MSVVVGGGDARNIDSGDLFECPVLQGAGAGEAALVEPDEFLDVDEVEAWSRELDDGVGHCCQQLLGWWLCRLILGRPGFSQMGTTTCTREETHGFSCRFCRLTQSEHQRPPPPTPLILPRHELLHERRPMHNRHQRAPVSPPSSALLLEVFMIRVQDPHHRSPRHDILDMRARTSGGMRGGLPVSVRAKVSTMQPTDSLDMVSMGHRLPVVTAQTAPVPS